jgi:hypothetical protein
VVVRSLGPVVKLSANAWKTFDLKMQPVAIDARFFCRLGSPCHFVLREDTIDPLSDFVCVIWNVNSESESRSCIERSHWPTA